jgi:hypothetical protein
MTDIPLAIAEEIERYLRTGDYDPRHGKWPGDFIQRDQRSHADLREALVCRVFQLAGEREQRTLPEGDTAALVRRKVEPMVRGLFRRAEQDTVIEVVARSVIFLTGENIERILRDCRWHSTAWELANLYLASVGGELLGSEPDRIVGLSSETTCYVSPEYFAETDPFADYIVHEVAHIFHNCKRRTLGLPETRTREWLLNIGFGRRETFAYACEAYSCIRERAATASERRGLAAEYGSEQRISDASVDPDDIVDIVREAALARNGWKVILGRCAPAPRGGREGDAA